MAIRLTYGARQQFRYRCPEVTIRGEVDGLAPPVRRAVYRLNEAGDRRFWPAATPEPGAWLCQEQDARVPADRPRHRRASFGLFQHLGMPIEWSDIRVVSHAPEDPPQPGVGRAPWLGRDRPGAF